MKRLIQILFRAILICTTLISCSKDDDSSNLQSGEFISINGDLRRLENLSTITVLRDQGIYSTRIGYQLSFELIDNSRKVIGNIGGFKNNELRVWATIMTDGNMNSPINYVTLHDDNIISYETFYPSLKCNLFINLLTDEEDELIYGSAISNQSVKAYVANGQLIIEWNNLQIKKDLRGSSDLEFKSSGRISSPM